MGVARRAAASWGPRGGGLAVLACPAGHRQRGMHSGSWAGQPEGEGRGHTNLVDRGAASCCSRAAWGARPASCARKLPTCVLFPLACTSPPALEASPGGEPRPNSSYDGHLPL